MGQFIDQRSSYFHLTNIVFSLWFRDDRQRIFALIDEWFYEGNKDKSKTINHKLSLSSPPHDKKERNSNERYQANGLFAPRKLFRGIKKLCADAGRIRMFFHGG